MKTFLFGAALACLIAAGLGALERPLSWSTPEAFYSGATYPEDSEAFRD